MGYPQRTVLVGQAAELAVLPLDHRNHYGVAPGVGLNVLQPRRAAFKEVGRGLNALLPVLVAPGWAAIWGQ